jgi:Zn-dependent protease
VRQGGSAERKIANIRSNGKEIEKNETTYNPFGPDPGDPDWPGSLLVPDVRPGHLDAGGQLLSQRIHELAYSLRYKIPVTSITLYIFGGIAQIAAEPPSPVAEFLIALAGPLTSFALAAVFGLLQGVLTNVAPALAAAKYLAYINGLLALFNLIPGFPLDGGRVFRAIVWGATRNLRRATEIAASVGRVIAFLFILVGVWQVLEGNWANGLWIAFIGWFLENAAVGQVQQQRLHDLLAGHTVSQAMSSVAPQRPPTLPCKSWSTATFWAAASAA